METQEVNKTSWILLKAILVRMELMALTETMVLTVQMELMAKTETTETMVLTALMERTEALHRIPC
jgi:hypothetical protein